MADRRVGHACGSGGSGFHGGLGRQSGSGHRTEKASKAMSRLSLWEAGRVNMTLESAQGAPSRGSVRKKVTVKTYKKTAVFLRF